jgi:hypothetical protein
LPYERLARPAANSNLTDDECLGLSSAAAASNRITRTRPASVLPRTSLAAKLARIRSIRDPGKGVPRVANDAKPSTVARAGGACRVAAPLFSLAVIIEARCRCAGLWGCEAISGYQMPRQ